MSIVDYTLQAKQGGQTFAEDPSSTISVIALTSRLKTLTKEQKEEAQRKTLEIATNEKKDLKTTWYDEREIGE